MTDENRDLFAEARAREARASHQRYKRKLERLAPKEVEKAKESFEEIVGELDRATEGMEDWPPKDIDVDTLKKITQRMIYKLRAIDAWQKLQNLGE